METLKQVTTYMESGRTFIICQDECSRYWAFENKFVKNGKLTRVFNGITGKMSNTINETLSRVHEQIRFDELMESGLSMEQAFKLIYG